MCRLNTIESFTAIACILIFLQGTYASGLIPATLETWEIAFKLTASELSPVVTLYVVAKLVCGIPLTYYCSSPSSWGIPRHLAWMFACIGLSSILTGMPWLMTSVEKKGEAANICYTEGHPDESLCSFEVASSGLQHLVFFAQVINGIAASCLYSLVPSFIESNTDSTRGTKYLSYFLASGPFGVAFGFVAQGVAVDLGVWGLLYWIVGFLLIVISSLMWKIPDTFENRVDSDTTATNSSSSSSLDDSIPGRRRSSLSISQTSMKDGLAAFGRDAAIILKNGVWWLFALAASVEAFFVVGINNYGPKIFSSYFSISTGSASMIAGALLVPAAVLGQICGGLCDSKRSKNLGQTASLTKYIALLAFVCVICIYAVQCDTLTFESRSEATCGNKCNCVDSFDPVCVNGKELHFNGCYAGCSSFDSEAGTYSNCTLCSSNTVAAPTHGVCDGMKCNGMIPMLVIFFVAVFTTFMNNPPSQMVMMRVVPSHLSANALALNDLTYRVVGSLPSVPVWAAAIDQTCMHRNKNHCGVEGECGYYDNHKLAMLFLLLGGIPKLLSFIAFFAGSKWLSTRMTAIAVRPYNANSNNSSNFDGSSDVDKLTGTSTAKDLQNAL